MPLQRLKLVSSHGDQTLPRLQFALYSAPTRAKVNELVTKGLVFAEGQSVVLADLSAVFNGWPKADEGGKVFVLGIPEQFHLGYSVFTTAYIDRTTRHVVGSPLTYTAARNHLAFYLSKEAEEGRERVESEVAEGYELTQRPTFVIDPRNIVGFFNPTPAFRSQVNRIKAAVDDFQSVPLEPLEEAVSDLFRPSEPATAVLTSSIVSQLLVASTEAQVMQHLRQMRWQGLKLLGYEFFNGDSHIEVTSPIHTVPEQLARIESMNRKIADPTFFPGQLAWLKQYVATELRIMRVELDEAL